MTWPTDQSPLPAMVAIDHVLVDRRIRLASARTVAIPGSDHRGVLTELVLPGG
jgi:endonuclease/exonuclease/phosphatase family metal-dependent hydrolase